ncbi:MAG: NTP transferase domain-containing protein [Deltaproteobacteria bacterium]|nr:NTP transferase domain-containing protein [Deltaproteobacteria bacterium]
MTQSSRLPVRCGIVLAGGEGKRLWPFIQRLRGDALPKQYVNFIGTRSMLEHTFCRAEKIILPDRLFTVVSRDHLRHPEVRRQLSGRPRGSVVMQPENKETGPGILLPLMHLYRRYPESMVVVFPSDHFIVEEDLFMAHVAFAFLVVEQNPSLLVLLGIEPNEPEPEYGYILPDGEKRILGSLGLPSVRLFAEKPEPRTVRELVVRGGLWNTMVMIFRTKTLLDLVRREAPRLYGSFLRILEAIGTRDEKHAVEKAYRHMKPTNFSKGLLEKLPLHHRSCLSVLPVSGVFWSDWGSEDRLVSDLKKTGYIERLQGISENSRFKIFGIGGSACKTG